MTTRAYALFWIGAAIMLLVVLNLLGPILLPFVLGAVIAYLLDPVAGRLERAGIPRLWGSLLILAAFTLLLVLLLVTLLPLLLEQLAQFVVQMPGYLKTLRQVLTDISQDWGQAAQEIDIGLEAALNQLAGKAPGWVAQVLASIWSGGLALVNFLALMFVTPLVAFYLLKDWDRMVNQVDSWLPVRHAPTIRMLASEIDAVISGFLRGQFFVLSLLSVFFVAGLTLIGLRFGLLIGLGAGLISFVPYLGPLVGFVVGGTMAVVQFWPDWMPIAGVLGVFLVGQMVEGNILSPLIVGDRVRLHPVWLIFALFAFGYFLGFVGLLLAVPMAAAIGVLVRFGLRRYLASPLYNGVDPGPTPKPAAIRRRAPRP